jgi:hypothetical protein
MRIDPDVSLKGAGSGAVAYRRLSRLVASLLVTLTLACSDSPLPSSPPAPLPAGGFLAGTITLLGDDGPTHPPGNVTLYASEHDLDLRIPRYATPLYRRSGTGRVYDFVIGNIVPGDYYVLGCWTVGCGAYHDPETGALRTVRIRRGLTTRLIFAL